jgi:hypothetical protein
MKNKVKDGREGLLAGKSPNNKQGRSQIGFSGDRRATHVF